jgi:hypothetical protein
VTASLDGQRTKTFKPSGRGFMTAKGHGIRAVAATFAGVAPGAFTLPSFKYIQGQSGLPQFSGTFVVRGWQ